MAQLSQLPIERVSKMYGTHATDIVGYMFTADVYCSDCIIDVVTCQPQFYGWALAEGVQMSTEDNLSEIAAAFSIDRMDEGSFDSGEFPKVIFGSQVESDEERCGACEEPLIPA